MVGVLGLLRSGDFLTRERIRLWAWAVLVAALGGALYILVSSDGVNDYQGRPLGTDFANVYAAGTYVREGRPELAFDPPAQHAREQKIFGAATPFYGWHYPPFFLFIAGLLALMPYAVALAVWQGVTLVLYLLAIRAIFFIPPLQGEGGYARSVEPGGVMAPTPPPDRLRRSPSPASVGGISGLWLLLALAYPAVFINLGHGHNGFLTAALIGAALVMLDRRPIVSGILFGLLAYKPQFGLLIPLVLAATGRWKTFAAAGVTVALLALVTTLAFGMKVWPAFMASTDFTRLVVLESGDTGWHKIQSVFSWVRMWGGPVPLAYGIQAGVAFAVAAALVWLWRSSAVFSLKAAALIIGALLATPYSLDYDLMVLAPALAFYAAEGFAHGFRPWEKTAFAALWIVPLLARSVAEVTLIPLGAPAMLIVFLMILRHAALSQHSRLVPVE
jgi:hypothetical protein